MPEYAVHQEFPPELWADEEFDKTAWMLNRLKDELISHGQGAVGEPEVKFSENLLLPGWGAGRACVEIE